MAFSQASARAQFPTKIGLFVDGSVDFGGDHALLSACAQNGAHNILSVSMGCSDLRADVTLWHLQVVPGVATVIHQCQIPVVSNINKLEITALDVGHVHVVSGWADIFVLPVGEDVEGDHVDLGVTVLAGLGGGHLHDLAGTTLDHDEAVLPESGALHGEGFRCSGISLSEIEISIISHCDLSQTNT